MAFVLKSFIPACAATIGLLGAGVSASAQTTAIDFGNDTSEYANEGACDDLRFQGEGMADIILTDDIGRDASDCSKAYSAGDIALNPMFTEPSGPAAIMYGDDTSSFANDGECDDIRFVHEDSSSTVYLAEDIGHDATDCKAGVTAGVLTWQGHRADIERGITAADLMEADPELSDTSA